MSISKTFKIIALIVFILSLTYLSKKYSEYNTIKSFVSEYLDSDDEWIIGVSIDSYFSKFGEFPIKSNGEFHQMVKELKQKYAPKNEFVFDRFPFGINIDTIKNKYQIYSYGPDKNNDGLDFLPINDMGKPTWNFNNRKVSFLDYLKINKDFDILLMERELNFNCNKIRDEIFSIKPNIEDSEDGLLKKFYNQIVEINHSEQLTQNESFANIDTTQLIFGYNGTKVISLCPSNLSQEDIINLEKILTKELYQKIDYVDRATFYVTLPPAKLPE